jgi:hypothetical protein
VSYLGIDIVVSTILLAVALLAAGTVHLAVALWAKRRRPRARGSSPLAGTWEGSLVKVRPNQLPVVAYLGLTLSGDGKYHNEVRAFQGATQVGKPETFTGTFTYEPGEGGEEGRLDIAVLQPKPCYRLGNVRWVGPDRFVYTSEGVRVLYHRVS